VLPLYVLTFAFALWFGCYLLARDFSKPALRFAGLGLLTYALALGLDLLMGYTPADLARWRTPMLLLPAVFWLGATLNLLPEGAALRPGRPFNLALPALVVVAYVLTALLGLGAETRAAYPTLALLIGLLWLAALYTGWRAYRAGLPVRPAALLGVGTLFFGLGMGLLLLPFGWLSPQVLLLAISVDLAFLGLAVVMLDAFEEGEALLPDMLRALVYAAAAALLLGGQVALIMLISGGVTFPLLTLLLLVIASAIAMQTFADPLQSALDRLILPARPRQERAVLRAAASALPRVNPALELAALDEAEFARLTRRALSHFGDLNRLASSPLTRLPLIETRLAEAGRAGNTLERAAELKALLAESIERLKPRGVGDFGTSDAWRYYNALYFPYVAGVRPYTRASLDEAHDPGAQTVIEWFRASVPERTLYNWQTAAAGLVAQDLRERNWG
jgi:hypothetical protein